MGTLPPSTIPFPLSSFPGATAQESAGRLVNCYSEPLGDPSQSGYGAPKDAIVWRRAPGLTQFAASGQTGYRGGLIVNNLSYEAFSGQAITVTSGGVVTLLGAFPGTKKISIARNQAATPNVVAVDIDNGAYNLATGGAPTVYNGAGNLPQPNSVTFQDGYFFFTIADGRCFASAINALTQNALTFVTAQAKSDVTLLRGIAYQNYLFLFTTGSCEVWQDQAFAAPAFPYGRVAILTTGLIQANAIAGFETGFDDLLWVAQDFGVWRLPQNTLVPVKVSPPDLDKLIEAQVNLGNTLEASVYIFAGKKRWVIQSPAWSWEFDLGTQKWFERTSLQSTGLQGRWRGTGGHPAFGKYLMGDQQSGAILFLDDTNYNDVTTQTGTVSTAAPMMTRLESGAVDGFPSRMRVARADFHFVAGTGRVAGNLLMNVTGAAAGTGGVVRLAVNSTVGVNTGDTGVVANVGGTTEANGNHPLTVIDQTHVELQGTVFVNAYTSGGTVTDVTVPASVVNPQVAISFSDDGGNSWSNPILRNIGQQSIVKTGRIKISNTGLTGVQGRRWRMDISDPVYTAFLKATQSSNPAEE
jgi:hypothetical protein